MMNGDGWNDWRNKTVKWRFQNTGQAKRSMEIGYQEMAEINRGLANEWCNVENEAEVINEGIWKGEM